MGTHDSDLTFTRLDYLSWRIVSKIAQARPGRRARAPNSSIERGVVLQISTPDHNRSRDAKPEGSTEGNESKNSESSEHHSLRMSHGPKRAAMQKGTASAAKVWEGVDTLDTGDAADAGRRSDEFG